MWKLIASADKNWGIGKANRLLVQIPSDMKRFRDMTMGNIVIMGRKTLDSFPGGLALQGRINIVLTRNTQFKAKNVYVVHNVDELVELLDKCNPEGRQVYVIGGASVYSQLLPYCDEAYITRIDHAYAADAYLPDLDSDGEWEKVSESDEQTYFDLEYTYADYKRKGSV